MLIKAVNGIETWGHHESVKPSGMAPRITAEHRHDSRSPFSQPRSGGLRALNPHNIISP